MRALLATLGFSAISAIMLVGAPSDVQAAATAPATVEVANGEIVVHGTDLRDDVIVEAADDQASAWNLLVFTDAPVDAGPGCTVQNGDFVTCGGPVSDVVAYLGGGQDSMSDDTFFHPTTLPQVMHGGSGDDFLFGSELGDRLYGEGGDDTFVTHDNGPADVFSGGIGRDRLSYRVSPGSEGVTVTEDGIANDGHPGEADNVEPDIELVHGTRYDDVISIPFGDLYGHEGNDRLTLTEAGGKIFGSGGRDVLDAGPGHASLFGEHGRDVLNSANGVSNVDDCAGNLDVANVDASDTTTNCETVNVA